MKIEETLKKIGLQEEETLIYLSLLEGGNATVAELSRRTNLYRPKIYKTIPTLIEKGLVTKNIIGKRILYIASSPERLESSLESIRDELQDILPTLIGMQASIGKKPILKYTEGKKAIISVFEDILTSVKKGGIYYRYSSVGDIFLSRKFKNNAYLPPNFFERQKNKQLERLVITSELNAKRIQPEVDSHVKIIPEEYDPFDENLSHIIYGNKVAFIDYEADTVIIMEGKRFADFQKKIFLFLYRKL